MKNNTQVREDTKNECLLLFLKNNTFLVYKNGINNSENEGT